MSDLRERLAALVAEWRGTARSCARVGGMETSGALYHCASELEGVLAAATSKQSLIVAPDDAGLCWEDDEQ